MRTMVFMIVIGSLLAAPAYANREVDIRLVRAQTTGSLSPQLADVADLLQNNLPFQGYSVLGRTRLPLPNRGQSVTFPGNLVVRCSGNQERLTVVVRRHETVLLNAVVSLRDNRPVILGGFPEGRDRLLLIVVAR